MLDKIFGSPLHEHADPAQRVTGVATLPVDSKALAQLLGSDPAPEVRAAAAARCADIDALTAALKGETDVAVRGSIAAALGRALAASTDDAKVHSVLASTEIEDPVRAHLARLTADDARRRLALEAIRDEDALVDVALGAEHAAARMAAAERVRAPDALQRLFKGARDKDRGVARLARERLDALSHRAHAAEAADALIREAEALLTQPGPVVMAAVELDRRWKALALRDDVERLTRWEAIGRGMQQRFDRELEEQRAHAKFEQRLNAWLATLQPQPPTTMLPELRATLESLRAEAERDHDTAAIARLDDADRQIRQWEEAAPAIAAAEALVLEAEQLATGTPIDDAQLPTRWQALDLAVRTPALTRRFEAALLVIEQRRLAVVRATQQEQGAARQQLHDALHEAEQALAAGHLQEARAAADRTRGLKPHAGVLPKPTIQRLSRVVQQLVELERWQSFGQQSARVQLCERAEALAQQALPPVQVAREVQQLRNEWKALDEKYAGVPKPLWERFDSACEKAYAPAARFFSEQHAQHKQARKQREDFIAAAAARVPELLAEPRDWRAVERGMRDIEAAWRGKDLGSVEPAAWKKLDSRLKEALAPLHEALGAARQHARQEREALIAEAEGLAAKAAEREAPSHVKDLQARWQANARTVVLSPRDERALWERFRVACNAVFEARRDSRKESDDRRHAQRRAFETVVAQMEQLAHSTEPDENAVRARQRELQEQWRAAGSEHGAVPAALEARFKSARSSVDDLLRGRSRASEAATYQALLAKELLCEELDAAVAKDGDVDAGVVQSVQQRWDESTALQANWERRLGTRRDAALQAIEDEDARYDWRHDLEKNAAARRDAILELELMLGIESPSDLQPQRLAVQVKHLRDRFKRSAEGSGGPVDVLLDWCSHPGVSDARDRQRLERIVAALARRR